MKGLLLKDLYCLGQNVKSLLFIIVIWGLVFLPQKDGGLLLISLSMMVSAMFTFTLSSYDRQVKWDTYALSMPLSRTAMVQEKYIVSILMLMAAAAISFPLTGLAWLIRTGGIDAEFLYAMYTTLLTGTAISLIYTALALPCSLWLGAEKGRYIPSVLFAAIFFAGIAMARGGRLKAMSPDLLSNFAILLLGLSLLVFCRILFYKHFHLQEERILNHPGRRPKKLGTCLEPSRKGQLFLEGIPISPRSGCPFLLIISCRGSQSGYITSFLGNVLLMAPIIFSLGSIRTLKLSAPFWYISAYTLASFLPDEKSFILAP